MGAAAAALAGVAAVALALGAWVWARAASERSAAELLVAGTAAATPARQRGVLLRSVLPPAPGFLLRRTDLRALEARLGEAARPYGLGAAEFVRLKTLAAGLVAVLAALLLAGSDLVVLALAALAAAAGGYRLPDVWLGSLASRRAAELERSLPNMVDSLVLAMDAGMDLEAALRRVVPRLRGPLRDVFDEVLAELNAGYSLTQALARLQSRTSSEALGDLLALIQQSRRLGVGLVLGLRTRADEMRTRRRLRAQAAAQRAPLKMTIPLVLFFLPALLIVFLAPAILSVLVGG